MSKDGSLSHIALVVSDAARTVEFFKQLFNVEEQNQSEADGPDETCIRMFGTLFVLPERSVERPLSGDHIAFSVKKEQMLQCAKRLDELGHSYQKARKDTALYFTDFDNHVFELECVGAIDG